MTKRIASLASVLMLACGIAVFTGSALAGNGHGNGNDKAAPTGSAAEPASQATPGNSATAPGHVKKDTAASQATARANGSGSAIQTSTAGVRPANDTGKDTYASATSNQTKLYGNGQTAGEIAVSSGYTGTLHGPGNSQPHKAAPCNGHEVDVHALKAKGLANQCSTTATATSTQSSLANTTKVTGSQGGSAPGKSTAPGSVLGAIASRSGPAGGVLGALASVGHGTLPFTGFPLWVVVLAAAGLVLFGLALRRQGRVTV